MKKGMNINDSVHGLVRLTAYEKKNFVQSGI